MGEKPKKSKPKGPTLAEAWEQRSKRPWLLELPSGNSIRIRHVPMTTLMRRGVIPMKLYSLAMGFDEKSEEARGFKDMKPEQIKDFLELMGFVVCASSVDPKIASGSAQKEGTISLDDVDDEDQFRIFVSAMGRKEGEGDSLERFPEEAGSSPDRPGGEEVPAKALEPAGH